MKHGLYRKLIRLGVSIRRLHRRDRWPCENEFCPFLNFHLSYRFSSVQLPLSFFLSQTLRDELLAYEKCCESDSNQERNDEDDHHASVFTGPVRAALGDCRKVKRGHRDFRHEHCMKPRGEASVVC